MQFETNNGRDYVRMDEKRVALERLYFSDPDEAGGEIVELIMKRLNMLSWGFSLVTVGDARLSVVTFEDDDGFTAQMGEVRHDEHGMKLETPIPRCGGTVVLPMVQIVRGEMTANVYQFAAPVPYGSVAQMVHDAVNRELTEVLTMQGTMPTRRPAT